MTIKQKLIASFSGLTVLIIALSIFAMIQLTNVDEDYKFLLEDRAYKVIEATNIQNATSLQGLALRSYILRKSEEDLTIMKNQQAIISEIIAEIEPIFTVKQMQDELQNIKEQQLLYSNYVTDIVAAVDAGNSTEAERILFNEAFPVYNSMQQSVNHIVEYQTEVMNTTSAQTTDAVNVSKMLMIALSIIGILIAIALTYKITVSITKPFRLTVAILGLRSISWRIASPVFPFALASRNLPTVISVRIIAADSKYRFML